MTFDNLIEKFGEEVTLKTLVLADEDTTYGTKTESYTSTAIKIVFMGIKEDDLLIRQGILDRGDVYGYIKTSQAIKEGDRIILDSIEWEVVDIRKYRYQGSEAYKKVALSKRS